MVRVINIGIAENDVQVPHTTRMAEFSSGNGIGDPAADSGWEFRFRGLPPQLMTGGERSEIMRLASSILLICFAFALVPGIGHDEARGQDRFVVDGDRRDWGSGKYPDTFFDVVPDSNNSIDIISYAAFEDHSGKIKREGREFYFLIEFLEPPYQGTEATSVELFFDVSADTTIGEATPPWVNFLPDYRIEIIGRNGSISKEIHHRLAGNRWISTEGEDLPEVEAAQAGQWLEGAIPWAALGNPGDSEGEKERGYFQFKWAVRSTQGGSHDYVPDGDNLQSPWSPMGGKIFTVVEPRSWGRIKSDARARGGLE